METPYSGYPHAIPMKAIVPIDTIFKLSILTPKIRMVKTLNLLQQGS